MRFFARLICKLKDHKPDLQAKGRLQLCQRCGELIDCCKKHGHIFFEVEINNRQTRKCQRCAYIEHECLACNRKGYTNSWQACGACNGNGFQDDVTIITCTSCEGKGGYYEACLFCYGVGWVNESSHITQ